MRCPNCRVEIGTCSVCPHCGALTARPAASAQSSLTVEPAPTTDGGGARRRIPEPPPPAVAPGIAFGNTSGTRSSVPEEISERRFCLPALLFAPLWCTFNDIRVPPRLYGGGCGSLVWVIATLTWLARDGYSLAWQYRRFADVDDFDRQMVKWQKAAGLTVLVIVVLVMHALRG